MRPRRLPTGIGDERMDLPLVRKMLCALDVRHSLATKVLLPAALLVAMLTGLVLWWVPSRPNLIHLVGTSLGRRLTIPVFSIGKQGVTPIALLKALVFLGLLAVLSNWVRKLLYQGVSKTTAFDPQHSYVLARFVSLLIYVVGLMIGLQAAGVNLNSLAILGGTLGIGVGFGLQSIVANWVAGLVLLVEQPFRIGDRIDVGGTAGVVGRVGFRSTWVRTYDNEVIIVPNSDFTTHQVTNWTVNDDRVRVAIGLVVPHQSDAEKVAALMLEVAREHPGVLTDPLPEALLNDIGQNSLHFSLRFWTIIQAHDNHGLKSDLRLLILKKLQEHGISIGEASTSAGKAAASAPL
ncbi:MAG: mechanosensitive ion channel domain-containing protein [Candidatus Sulfotelmatobacter sp.]